MSILNQNWDGNIIEDIEIVLVDDCSTDKTKQILKHYNIQYSNINVYSTEKNSGYPSIPRNIGIEKSKGQYLMFMDNDDEYCEDICKTLFETIIQEEADIITCNYYNIFDSKISEIKLKLNVENYTQKNNFIILDSYNAILLNDILIWTKIYKKSIIIENNIKFPKRGCEDVFFNINYFINSQKIIYLNNYFGIKRHMRKDSLSVYPDANRIIQDIKCSTKIQKILDSHIKTSEFRFSYLKESISHCYFRILNLKNKKDMEILLNYIYELENKFSFDENIDVLIYDFINFFVKKKQFNIAVLIINMINLLKIIYNKLFN